MLQNYSSVNISVHSVHNFVFKYQEKLNQNKTSPSGNPWKFKFIQIISIRDFVDEEWDYNMTVFKEFLGC